MTPYNIANMAALKGLEFVALTDHNSTLNCPAFISAARDTGLAALPGMELNTSEEIHAVCLFGSLEAAHDFGKFVREGLPDIKNRPDVFGRQIIYDCGDNPAGEEEKLLISASRVSISELDSLIRRWEGVWFPAHIDRSSNSLLANLGLIPAELRPIAFEYTERADFDAIAARNPVVLSSPRLVNSDAHYLPDISEPRAVLPEEITDTLLTMARRVG